ncbi:MAG: N-acetyl-gamma-glutamyl-phosphate reductase [Acidimicrobiales bacterium]
MKTAVIGASGYLGAELLRLLARHPAFEVALAQGDRSAGERVATLHPGLEKDYPDLVVEPLSPESASRADVVFVALPSGHSQDVVAELVDATRVVDLGADFRLREAKSYEQWYGFTHRHEALLAKAVYGLPELNRAALVGASLIAAPGCYVTAAALALVPLLEAGVIEPGGVIVDAASGVSGAGREPTATTHFGAVNENFSAYGLVDHRHTPEIEQVTGAEVLFTPHLAPMTRGILVTAYARATASRPSEELLAIVAERYGGERFVEVVEHSPGTRETYGSNLAKLTVRSSPRTGQVIALCAIDNLTKGGAGQAIQAANIACGIGEASGLDVLPVVP